MASCGIRWDQAAARRSSRLSRNTPVVGARSGEPGKWQSRKRGFRRGPIVPDLDDQHPIGIQELCRAGDDGPHGVESIVTSRQCDLRLVRVLGRQLLHRHGV